MPGVVIYVYFLYVFRMHILFFNPSCTHAGVTNYCGHSHLFQQFRMEIRWRMNTLRCDQGSSAGSSSVRRFNTLQLYM